MEHNVMYDVGKAKYVVNYHVPGRAHEDGSKFFDIRIFKNKKELAKFIKQLTAPQ
jgi:hypothetical protein